MDVNSILEATRKALGADSDLSYITEAELEKAGNAKLTEISTVNWELQGNSLVHHPDGHWEWWDGCDTKKRYTWKGSLNKQQLVNCLNGLIHYKLWG